MNRLPTNSADRKKIALDALFDYFGDALVEVAQVIHAGQVQHNTTGWDRTKSTDHDACLLRHFMDRGSLDVDGMSHRAKMAWRALAALQLEVEDRRGLPPPRGVSVPAKKPVPPCVGHEFEPEQLELPFTGKQLAVKDLTEADIGQKFRVVSSVFFTGREGTLQSLEYSDLYKGPIARFIQSNGESLNAALPDWRFERI